MKESVFLNKNSQIFMLFFKNIQNLFKNTGKFRWKMEAVACGPTYLEFVLLDNSNYMYITIFFHNFL
jgi:hypothetical protein